MQIGDRLSHYQIVEKLGEGGMGAVYLADDLKLHRKVAVKVLRDSFYSDKTALHRFEREAIAASALNHPNILTIYEIGETDGAPFMVSEFVEGVSLKAKNWKMDLAESVDIVIQIASALDTAHRNGIVHRDIKPDNIMIRDDGLVKVLDFGLAKRTRGVNISSDPESTTLHATETKPGMILGTVSYMSPEQARGLPTDERTDIWSFGVVLYEMFTGKHPFQGATDSDVMAAILKSEPAIADKSLGNLEIEHVIRKALRKDKDARYQTMRSMLADLREVNGASNTAATVRTGDASRPTTSTRFRSIVGENKLRAGISATILFIAFGIGTGYYLNRPVSIKTLAVMPFMNQSEGVDVEYLSDGMTETLIGKLAQLPNMTVKARASVFHYKGKNVDPKTIGAELGVQAILNGRVVNRNDQLTLFLELVDAASGDQIWSERYDGKQTDLVAMQNDIALDVSQKLRSKLSGVDEARLAKSQTSNPEAYRLYLNGRFHINQLTDDGFFKARDYFQQAIDKDPGYALAYAGLADAYQTLSGWNAISANDGMPKADMAARTAIELDDSLAEGHAVFGIVQLLYHRNWQSAESEFKRAIILNLNSADAHKYYAMYLVSMRRFDEAHAEMRQAHELDPLSIDKLGGDIYYFQRDYDRATEQFRKALSLDPNSGYAHWALGLVLAQKGMYTEAIEEYQKSILLSGPSPDEPAMLAVAYAYSGNTKEARKILDELRTRSSKQYIAPTVFAFIHIALGEKDEAFAMLDRAVAESDPLLLLLNVEPFFDPLRSDPRFHDLVRRLGLP
ncbi:MAG: protein kinase [Pyrinomonadaceae bacterium]